MNLNRDSLRMNAASRRFRKQFTLGGCIFGLCVVGAAFAADPAIVVIAGTGTEGFSGDGGPAVQAMLKTPSGVAVATNGNVFISDSFNHRIRRIGADGIIQTIAGTTLGDSGDGGLATAAQLNNPTGLVIEGDGSIIFSDTSNHRVRKIDPRGVITTVAGVGSKGAAGVEGGPATSAELNSPAGLALRNGVLYIADSGNHRVRKVEGGLITTVVGTGKKGFSGDGGLATAAQLKNPVFLLFDPLGNLLIADGQNFRVRKVDTGGIISTLAGSGNPLGGDGEGGLALEAGLSTIVGLALDGDGNLYIADSLKSAIRKVTSRGKITTVPVVVNAPVGLAIDQGGNLFIADSRESKVLKVSFGGATPPITPLPKPGDLDKNGKITVQDAVLILQLVVTPSLITDANRALADVNGDGLVNVVDAILTLKRAVGLI